MEEEWLGCLADTARREDHYENLDEREITGSGLKDWLVEKEKLDKIQRPS